jgi:hypothetical protein
MSYIVLGGRPLLGGGSVFGLYVAKDAITNLKIVDTLFFTCRYSFYAFDFRPRRPYLGAMFRQ